jgi:hypothetical protein
MTSFIAAVPAPFFLALSGTETLASKSSIEKMTTTEKEAFKWKMEEYDKADADDGETLPPTPTPV